MTTKHSRAADHHPPTPLAFVFGFALAAASFGSTPLAERPTVTFTQDSPGIATTASTGDLFGSALAAGDFDCDGIDDLAIGAPGEHRVSFTSNIEDAGLVHVLYGAPGGLSTANSIAIGEHQLLPIADGAEPFDRFASVLAAGNFNGDTRDGIGCDDLIVGVPAEDLDTVENTGQLWILEGGPGGPLGGEPGIFLPEAIDLRMSEVVGAAETADLFAGALVAGDFDDDGYDDLAVGGLNKKIFQELGAGAVWVFKGSAVGLTLAGAAQGWQQYLARDTAGMVGNPQEFAQFGSSLGACDLDGDGIDDLAIGVPGQDVSSADRAGAVVAVLGSTAGFGTSVVSSEVRNDKSDAEFGWSLGSGRLVAEGAGELERCELISGAPGTKVVVPGAAHDRAGEVAILRWIAGALQRTERYAQEDLGGSSSAGDRLGWAVATGDVGGLGTDQVMLGAPRKGRVSAGDETGAVYSFEPAAEQTEFLDPQVFGSGFTGGRFGTALAIGNFDGDDIPDLAIGAPRQFSPAFPFAPEVGEVRLLYSLVTEIFADGFESGDTALWSVVAP